MWHESKNYIDVDEPCLLLIDDTATNKQYDEKLLGHVKKRWSIETFHRKLQQTCGLERCQARTSRAQRNPVLLSILAWMRGYK